MKIEPNGMGTLHQQQAVVSANSQEAVIAENLDEEENDLSQKHMDESPRIKSCKRGKKAQSLEEYKQHVQGKIDELIRLIKDPSTSLEDRKKYRNQKTSYNARLRNRCQTSIITNRLDEQSREISQLMGIVKSCVGAKMSEAISQKVNQQMPEMARRLPDIFKIKKRARKQ